MKQNDQSKIHISVLKRYLCHVIQQSKSWKQLVVAAQRRQREPKCKQVNRSHSQEPISHHVQFDCQGCINEPKTQSVFKRGYDASAATPGPLEFLPQDGLEPAWLPGAFSHAHMQHEQIRERRRQDIGGRHRWLGFRQQCSQ